MISKHESEGLLATMRVHAETNSAISVVNALTTGKGATIGIDLLCRVSLSLRKTRKPKQTEVSVRGGVSDSHGLVKTCAEFVLKSTKSRIPRGYQFQFEIDSEIPMAVGLKSSSAVSTAAVKATCELLGESCSGRRILDISCRASIASGASLTGAYDDAAGCLLGGLVLADNFKFRILKHVRVPEDLGRIVLILVPRGMMKFTSSIDRSVYAKFRDDSKKAFEYALKQDVPQAMLLNSLVQCKALGYSFKPISDAMSEGATASGVTGKGPAIAALCKQEKTANRVRKIWLEDSPDSKILATRVVQPKKSI